MELQEKAIFGLTLHAHRCGACLYSDLGDSSKEQPAREVSRPKDSHFYRDERTNKCAQATAACSSKPPITASAEHWVTCYI
jgi:hypothetical protein